MVRGWAVEQAKYERSLMNSAEFLDCRIERLEPCVKVTQSACVKVIQSAVIIMVKTSHTSSSIMTGSLVTLG